MLVRQCFYLMIIYCAQRTSVLFLSTQIFERKQWKTFFQKNLEQISDYAFGLLAWQKISGSQATSNIVTIWWNALQWQIERLICYTLILTMKQALTNLGIPRVHCLHCIFHCVFSTPNTKEIPQWKCIYVIMFVIFLVKDELYDF